MAHIRKNDPASGYYIWLLDMVGLTQKEQYRYSMLLDKLHCTEFIYVIERDKNRLADGLNLREKYSDEMDFDIEESELDLKPCSVLEMLVALSCRLYFEVMWDPDDEGSPSKWLWIMLKNLGLDSQDDSRYDDEFVDEVLQKWMHRKFDANGNGSIFPVNLQGKKQGIFEGKKHEKGKNNQKNVEIWYQMCEYIEENFNVLD